jgi:hypothetical protein
MYGFGCGYPCYPPYGGGYGYGGYGYGGGLVWIIAIVIVILLVFWIIRPCCPRVI